MTSRAPTCPHCGHEMSTDEMLDSTEADLFAIAPDEQNAQIECPRCDKTYWVKGGYIPTYTSAIDEDDL